MAMTTGFPTTPEELTPGALSALVGTMNPGVQVTAVTIVDSAITPSDGQRVSTAGRIAVDVSYSGPGADKLPTRLMLKVARPEYGELPLYLNEVNVYTKLRPELTLDTPQCYGGYHDLDSGTFAVALDDLRSQNIRFTNVKDTVGKAQLRDLLEAAAVLHATYWESPRFTSDLTWLHPHVSGPIHALFTDRGFVPLLIEMEVDREQFKRELVESVSETTDSLYEKVNELQRHQATLPRTIVHGDMHIGNTYSRGGGSNGGFVDWQLTARGYCMHDVAYLVATGLSVQDRRLHERELIAGYRRTLDVLGVQRVPTFDEMWFEYRLAIAWGLYIGWLTSPTDNYGWDITVMNHIRLATAYRDLKTADAFAELGVMSRDVGTTTVDR